MRRPGVPAVLLGHRHDDLVEQRVAQPGDLRTTARARRTSRSACRRSATRAGWRDAQTPITAPGCIALVGRLPCRESSVIGTWSAIECTLNPCNEFTPAALALGIRCAVSNGRRVAEVEDAAEVDVEGVGPLAGEDLALADLVHGRGREVGVVRRAPRTDVDRRARQSRLARTLVVAVLDPGEGVELRTVPGGRVDACRSGRCCRGTSCRCGPRCGSGTGRRCPPRPCPGWRCGCRR